MAWRVDCTACASFKAARDIPSYTDEEITDEWYDNIPNYMTWPGFTERERLAIDFYSGFIEDHRALEQDDDLWNRLHANFSNVEIEDLVVSAAFIDASNKIREVFLGPPPPCAVENAAASN
jgi:alkylhydroperoxidase family enzyme